MENIEDTVAEEGDPKMELLQHHKKEKKDLQSQITKLKHSISKGDKKGKKNVQEQIAKMEAELNDKHTAELKELENQKLQTEQIAEGIENLSTVDNETETSYPNKKPSKAQKRRDKKANAERERQERIEKQEIENLTGVRNVEFEKIKNLLKMRNLQIFEIPSDGNCLYNAVAHQVQSSGIETDNSQLRRDVSRFMRENQDEFLPFLTTENGDPFTQEDFENYCKELESTSAWGGHLEVKALSHILKQPIEIVQGDGPPIKIGEEYDQKNLTLIYHRHAYGLGEHYNSVEPYKEDSPDF